MGADASSLRVNNLSKKFGTTQALDRVSFALGPGQCLALLGPNGAGKTTCCDMISGLVPIDEGSVVIHGKSQSPKYRREISQGFGLLNQETVLYRKYTVKETLEMFASFYDVSLPVDLLRERFELEDFWTQRLDRLSGGQRQRVYFACSMVHDPQLLLLDEPTTGLDPSVRQNMWDYLKSLKKEGKSILLTTHYLEEAEFLADHIAVLDSGRIIAEGTPEQLIAQYAPGYIISLKVQKSMQAIVLGEMQQDLGSIKVVADGDDFLVVQAQDAQVLMKRLQAILTDTRIRTGDIQIRRCGLNEVFLKLTGRSIENA